MSTTTDTDAPARNLAAWLERTLDDAPNLLAQLAQLNDPDQPLELDLDDDQQLRDIAAAGLQGLAQHADSEHTRLSALYTTGRLLGFRHVKRRILQLALTARSERVSLMAFHVIARGLDALAPPNMQRPEDEPGPPDIVMIEPKNGSASRPKSAPPCCAANTPNRPTSGPRAKPSTKPNCAVGSPALPKTSSATKPGSTRTSPTSSPPSTPPPKQSPKPPQQQPQSPTPKQPPPAPPPPSAKPSPETTFARKQAKPPRSKIFSPRIRREMPQQTMFSPPLGICAKRASLGIGAVERPCARPARSDLRLRRAVGTACAGLPGGAGRSAARVSGSGGGQLRGAAQVVGEAEQQQLAAVAFEVQEAHAAVAVTAFEYAEDALHRHPHAV